MGSWSEQLQGFDSERHAIPGAFPPAPLRGRQVRADDFLDQRVPEQRDLPCPAYLFPLAQIGLLRVFGNALLPG